MRCTGSEICQIWSMHEMAGGSLWTACQPQICCKDRVSALVLVPDWSFNDVCNPTARPPHPPFPSSSSPCALFLQEDQGGHQTHGRPETNMTPCHFLQQTCKHWRTKRGLHLWSCLSWYSSGAVSSVTTLEDAQISSGVISCTNHPRR